MLFDEVEREARPAKLIAETLPLKPSADLNL
jgi:hypothetical protein